MRLWQTGKEIDNTIGASRSVLECVTERGEILEPPLDPRVVNPKFAVIFQKLVTRKNVKVRAPNVASKMLYCLNNVTCLQIQRSPNASLRVEDSTANKGDGSHGAVGLLLLKRSPKTIDAGVAVHPVLPTTPYVKIKPGTIQVYLCRSGE